jgi:hypothetical protein
MTSFSPTNLVLNAIKELRAESPDATDAALIAAANGALDAGGYIIVSKSVFSDLTAIRTAAAAYLSVSGGAIKMQALEALRLGVQKKGAR